MRVHAIQAPSAALLVLLVLNFVWPRSVLPSLMVTPFLMGGCTLALSGLAFRPVLSRATGAWLAMSLLAIGLSQQPEPLALIALAAAAIGAWIAIALGQEFDARRDLLTGVMWALVAGMVINTLVAGLQYVDVERALYPWVSQNASGRPYGNLRQANHLATFSTIGLLAVWWLYREARLSVHMVCTLALLAILGVAFSASRTGLLELVVLSGFMLLWRKSARPLELAVFVLAPVWMMLLVECLQFGAVLLGHELEGIRGRDSASTRLVYWQEAWSLALQHPINGVGWGNLAFARVSELPFNARVESTANAHNLVMHLLAETGFAITFFVLAPVAWALWRRPPWRLSGSNARWAWMVIAVVGTHSLLEYPLWYMNFLIPTAFAFGLLLSFEPTPTPSVRGLPKALTVFASCLLLVGAASALYDYLRVASAFDEDNRASADLAKVASIQSTFFYRHYADRALLERVPLTDANAAEMLKVTTRLLNEGPNPLVFWVRVGALCRLGETLQAREVAALYGKAFPKSHAEFMQVNGQAVLTACGLLPNAGAIVP